MEACEKALTGDLRPAYYLASIDPGHGKTLALAEFLKTWRTQANPVEAGALIGVSRRSEIESYIEAAQLGREQFGVLTSDPELNALGAPQARHDRVSILFTTHQMIESRTRGRSFGEVKEFHYQGQPRLLRIWDESFLPAATLSVSWNNLGRLLPLRLRHPQYVDGVEALMKDIEIASDGSFVVVPIALSTRPSAIGMVAANLQSAADKDMVAALSTLAGQSVLVVSEGGSGKSLVAVGEKLPSDFQPVIIADASGRVRGTYAEWERHRNDLVRLPASWSDYRNLDVRLWQRTSGMMVLEDPRALDDVVQGIADAINEDEDDTGEWLVIHYKRNESLIEDLKTRVVSRPDRVRGLHWGNHHGTNEFRDVGNVVLIGSLTYPRSGYAALALASGVPADELSESDREMRLGERAHHYLQAACRGAVRKVTRGFAGHMRLFVIASATQNPRDFLRDIFPGCSIVDWRSGDGLNGKAKLVAEYLRERFSDPEVQRVRKREVREAVGINQSGSFSSRIMGHQALLEYLHGQRIDHGGQWFERFPTFDVIEDGYVYSADDD